LEAVRAWFMRDASFKLVSAWLIALLLMFNFASPSFKSYTPLVLLQRYLIPILLPAAVLTAGLLARLFETARRGFGRHSGAIILGNRAGRISGDDLRGHRPA
jgi:hypothetical protein